MGQIYMGPNQWLPAHGGQNVNIPPVVGTIRLLNNVRHNLMHGDRLWYSFSGQMGNQNVEVHSAFTSNRNFGAPNVLRRSNTTVIGHMSYQLYYYCIMHCTETELANGTELGQEWQQDREENEHGRGSQTWRGPW